MVVGVNVVGFVVGSSIVAVVYIDVVFVVFVDVFDVVFVGQ